MIPKINNRGHSFKGVTAYLMHDKKASTAERVAWSETGNMHTQDIEKASLVMAYFDKNAEHIKENSAGRKSEVGNVYHYSLSWAHGENPDQKHQQEQALKTIDRLGLSEHQYYMVAHNDTEHKHLHIVANLVNPQTGKIHTPSFDKLSLQSWALEYEKEHVMHCHKREENAKKRAEEQEQKQDYSEKITRAYYAADSGKAFIHSLDAEGLHLAKARNAKNFVIVDDKGIIQKLSRQLAIDEKGKKKTEAIQKLLKDVDREKLKDADALANEIKANIAEKLKPYDRDAQEVKQQKNLAEAAEKAAETKALSQQKLEEAARLELKQKQEALQVKRAAAEKERQAFAERERERKIQWQINQKTTQSRKKWDIDGFIKKRDQAASTLQQNSGFIARLTGKKQTFADKLEAQEKTLAERMWRFEMDINFFNKERSPSEQRQALKKQGFERKAIHPQSEEIKQDEKQVARNIEQAKAVQAQRAEKEQLNNPINDNMNKKIDEHDAPSASWFTAKKTKIFDSRREWELVAFEKSVAEQAAQMHQASARPIEQKFNDIGETRSPEELEKIIEAQKSDNENDLRESFEEGLSKGHRETLQRYRSENPQAEQKQESQSQDQSQGHSIDHD